MGKEGSRGEKKEEEKEDGYVREVSIQRQVSEKPIICRSSEKPILGIGFEWGRDINACVRSWGTLLIVCACMDK